MDFDISEEAARSGANNNAFSTNAQYENECSVVIEYIANFLLKPESMYIISVQCINELVDNFDFGASSATTFSVVRTYVYILKITMKLSRVQRLHLLWKSCACPIP